MGREIFMIHESFRDLLAAEYLVEEKGEVVEKYNPFIEKAHLYADFLAFTTGLVEPTDAGKLIKNLLNGVECYKPEDKWYERLFYLESIMDCCRANPQIDKQIIDQVATKFAAQIIAFQPLT